MPPKSLELDFGPRFREPRQPLSPGAVLLAGFVKDSARELLDTIGAITQQAPFRRMLTPGGRQMSVAMSNCGSAGWVTDQRGYRYTSDDPETGRPWPTMPGVFSALASAAAASAGFADFAPDACLINRYEPGAQVALWAGKLAPSLPSASSCCTAMSWSGAARHA